jgi:hypothetical protein
LKSVFTLTGSFPALCAGCNSLPDMASHEGGDSGKLQPGKAKERSRKE